MGCPFQIFTSLPENGAPIKALSMKKPQVHTCSAEKLTPLMHKNMERREATSSQRSKRPAWASSTGDLRDGRCRALPPNSDQGKVQGGPPLSKGPSRNGPGQGGSLFKHLKKWQFFSFYSSTFGINQIHFALLSLFICRWDLGILY